MISWLQEIARKTAYHYPFTISGTVLALISVYLLGFSYALKNFTVLFLAVTALTVLIIFWALGKLQAVKFSRQDIVWSVPPYVFARRQDSKVGADIGNRKCMLFFRIHLSLSIVERTGETARLRIYREGSFSGPGTVTVPLLFPLSGEATLRGRLKVGDVVGLTRCRFGPVHESRVSAIPSLIGETDLTLNPEGGMDTRNRQKSADEEKYYMRDYIPGDKLRDINWKASTRSDDVFTRISPVSQERTRTLFIDFRHYTGGMHSPLLYRSTRERVYHLDFLKSWLLSFLWEVKRQDRDYRFDVLTGRGRVVLEEEEDIIKLGYQLGNLFFQADPGESHQRSETEEVYIFTSPFDGSLNRALTAYSGFQVHLFQTAFPGSNEEESRTVPVFEPGQLFFPGWWAFARENRKLMKNHIPRVPGAPGRTKTERISIRTAPL